MWRRQCHKTDIWAKGSKELKEGHQQLRVWRRAFRKRKWPETMHAVEVEYKREVLVGDKKKSHHHASLGRVTENEQIQNLDLFSPLKGDKVQIVLCKVPEYLFGWMFGWGHQRMDIWMLGRWMGGWMDRVGKWMVDRMDRWMGEWMSGWVFNGYRGEWWIFRWMFGRLNEKLDSSDIIFLTIWLTEPLNGWLLREESAYMTKGKREADWPEKSERHQSQRRDCRYSRTSEKNELSAW